MLLKVNHCPAPRSVCTFLWMVRKRGVYFPSSDCIAPEILFESEDDEQNSSYTLAVDIWSLECLLFRLFTQGFPFPKRGDLRLYLRSKKLFPLDILIKHYVSEDGVSLTSGMMKSNPADRIRVTMALLHSWLSTQESTPIPGNLDSFKDNIEDELDNKSAKEGSITESCKCILINIPNNNV